LEVRRVTGGRGQSLVIKNPSAAKVIRPWGKRIWKKLEKKKRSPLEGGLSKSWTDHAHRFTERCFLQRAARKSGRSQLEKSMANVMTEERGKPHFP